MNTDYEKAKAEARVRFEAEYGQVWDTAQVEKEFRVLGFSAPLVSVVRKSDEVAGSLQFNHSPRFYFNFIAHG